MKKLKIALFFILISISLVSCNKEDEIPGVELMSKPEGRAAFLKISVLDTTYFLQDSVDGFFLASSARTSTREDIEFPAWVGVSFFSDSSLLHFNISNIYQRAPKRELLYNITQTEQELAYITYESGNYNFRNYGFSINIQEQDSIGGLPRDYSSYMIKQTETAYFNITNYYMGDQWFTVWLEGNFDVIIKRNGTSVPAEGEFLLQFPMWSTD